MTLVRRFVLVAACGLVGGLCPQSSWSQDVRRPALGRYDVVALRVEFQPDENRFTTGNGTFDGDLYGGLEPNVDPFPHDGPYFEAHLEFLKHYVHRVSNGRAHVETHLLPHVVRVSQPMGAYSPTGPQAGSDAELARLAGLVDEAWSLAEAYDLPSDLVPERTAFVLFHAGVGRDVELVGTTLDKTPEDLPSLHFGKSALDRLLGGFDRAIAGLPINNTIVLPRTQTRRGMDFIRDEPFLLELSINGLLAANFFSFLGVPDLFDTETGRSGIGPFGLMDPQGIFAFRGLFPPEPMAWTKQFLGWTDPVHLTGNGPLAVSLQAHSLFGSAETARAVISEAEYFLIENRYRDPEGDGLTLRVWQRGEIVEQHVQNGDPSFNNLVIDGFVGGVVVGVDNYDWALPGGLDEHDNELNGGILIWHVDERLLRAGLPTNSVNVLPDRAVQLKEADSAQDLGFPSASPFGPRPDLGSPFDFFYRGNPTRVITETGREISLYRNRFGPDTYPNSNTKAGGPSFIVLDDFSEPGPVMTLQYYRESVAGVHPLEIALAGAVAESRFPEGSAISAVDDLLVVYDAETGTVFAGPIEGDADPDVLRSAVLPVTGRPGRLVLLRQWTGGFELDVRAVEDGVLVPLQTLALPDAVRDATPASPLLRTGFERAEVYSILMRGAGGTVLVQAATHSGESFITEVPVVGEPIGLAAVNTNLGEIPVIVGRRGAAAAGSGPAWTFDVAPGTDVGQPVFGRDSGGWMGAMPLTGRNELLILGSDEGVTILDVAAVAGRFGLATDAVLSSFPVLADLDGDGRLDVLIAFGSTLFAFTQSGAVADHFPIRVPAAVTAQPLVAAVPTASPQESRLAAASQTDGAPVVIVAAADGYVYAYDVTRRERLLPGLPLEVGDEALATPYVEPGRLFAVSRSGTLKAWEHPGLGSGVWMQFLGTGDHGSYVELGGAAPLQEVPAGLIAAGETYNWPNPIQDGATHLRIRTERDARVTVTIIDAAGRLVDDVDMGQVRGGIPSEVVWHPNVASGLYFARFTATSPDGARETRLVKMAVIR